MFALSYQRKNILNGRVVMNLSILAMVIFSLLTSVAQCSVMQAMPALPEVKSTELMERASVYSPNEGDGSEDILQDKLIASKRCWPLLSNRTSMENMNPQADENHSQFKNFDPEILCLPFDINRNFFLPSEDASNVNSPASGLVFLLMNAQYLFSPVKFKELALSLSYKDAQKRDQRTFTDGHFINSDVSDAQVTILESSNSYFVIFQGTTTMTDWIQNVDFIPNPNKKNEFYHPGFLKIFDSVQEKIINVLNQHPEKKVVLTGHSLGGALAQIFLAKSLTNEGYFESQRIQSIITWASPRSVSSNLAKEVEMKAYQQKISISRIANDKDPIPHVPPLVLGYSAIGYTSTKDLRDGRWIEIRDIDIAGFTYRPKDLTLINQTHMCTGYIDYHLRSLFMLNR